MIKAVLSDYSKKFNECLPKYFPMPEGDERRVVEAMLYSVSNGGKRLRPFLVSETAKLFGVDFEKSLNMAVSLEMVHAYSLIHDDLPAMDNDDLRRGVPTCHKKFDEATAILAGDGLLTYAFEILCDEPKAVQLVRLLGNAAGAFTGMVAGQMLELVVSAKEGVKDDVIERIEEMKTGRLIRYACEAGAVLGSASDEARQALVGYSRKIGVAFQIADDILDVEGDQAEVGKALRKDEGQNKPTFVRLYGLEKAKELSKQMIVEAKELLGMFGSEADNLRLLADYIIERKS